MSTAKPGPTCPLWRLELMGGFRAIRGATELTRFRTRRTGTLLAYLAYHPERVHAREVLIELLWPDEDPAVSRHKLSVALSSLRGQLEPPGIPDGAVLGADRGFIWLQSGAVRTDVAEYVELLERAAGAPEEARLELLGRAADLYRGHLLPGMYDDWVLSAQSELEERFLQNVHALAELHAAAGTPERAIPHLLRAVSDNPLREETHRELIRLYRSSGQPEAAERQHRRLEQILVSDLDLRPAGRTDRIVPIRTTRAAFYAAAAAGLSPFAPVPETRPDAGSSNDSSPSDGPPVVAGENATGALLLGSRLYIERAADGEVRAALHRRDSVVLLQGPRQVGKTSLLARGLQEARDAGARVAVTDVQLLSERNLSTTDALLRTWSRQIAEQLDTEPPSPADWMDEDGPTLNFRRWVRRLIGTADTPMVWGLDEVDRLFEYSFAGEVFGMLRAWHNERALSPQGPWSRLTLILSYASEAYLFIRDPNQSPFNIGTRLALCDFEREQVAELNRRYGTPLTEPELPAFLRLTGGQPYLTQVGLREIAYRGTTLRQLEQEAQHDVGVYADHLRRLWTLLAADATLLQGVASVLTGRPSLPAETFYRLRSVGLLTGESAERARMRCGLYAAYLSRLLPMLDQRPSERIVRDPGPGSF